MFCVTAYLHKIYENPGFLQEKLLPVSDETLRDARSHDKESLTFMETSVVCVNPWLSYIMIT